MKLLRWLLRHGLSASEPDHVSQARITVRPGSRAVGICGKCGEAVTLGVGEREASCLKGCTVVRLPSP